MKRLLPIIGRRTPISSNERMLCELVAARDVEA
jgi:hypothetical protein